MKGHAALRAVLRGGFYRLAAAIVATLLLAGCTYESEKLDSLGRRGSFDLEAVSVDAALAARVPPAIKKSGTLKVGTNAVYPPAEFLDDGKPAGFDMELARALAEKLGLTASIQTADFSSLIPALGTKYDISISSFTINRERLENVDMVSSVNVGTSWAVAQGNPDNVSIQNICGRTVGVQTGTVQEDPDLMKRNTQCLAEGKNPITVVTLKSQTDITTRLINRSIDAMAADSPVVSYAIDQAQGKIEQLGSTYDQEPQGIAIKKGDMELTRLIKDGLDALKTDGTYMRILEAWNAQEAGLETFDINPQVHPG